MLHHFLELSHVRMYKLSSFFFLLIQDRIKITYHKRKHCKRLRNKTETKYVQKCLLCLDRKASAGDGDRVIRVSDSPLCSVNMFEPRTRGSFGTRGFVRTERIEAPLAPPRSFACWAPMLHHTQPPAPTNAGLGPREHRRRTLIQ